VLDLARDRSADALPYLVTPEHTRSACARLGPDALLVAEQKVVVDTDPCLGRDIGRERVGPHLRLSNYVANLRRIGFDADDVTFPGGDRLVDALAIHEPETAADKLRAHLAAGAIQVPNQVLFVDDDILPGRRHWPSCSDPSSSILEERRSGLTAFGRLPPVRRARRRTALQVLGTTPARLAARRHRPHSRFRRPHLMSRTAGPVSS
jgi:hypothetical protein